MSFRTTLVLLLLLILAGGFYYWDSGRQEQAKKTEDLEKALVDIADANVSEVELKTVSGESLSFVKRDATWYLTKPIEAKADQTETGNLVKAVIDARRDRIVTEKPEKLEPFGLEPPTATVSLQGRAGSKAATVKIGSKNPTNSFVYYQMEGSEAVGMIPTTLYASAEKKLFDYRDKNVLEFENTDVQEFTVTFGAKKFVVKQEGANTWKVVEPMEAKADESTVSRILNGLKSAKVHEFVAEEPANLADYGLNQPLATCSLKVSPDSAQKVLEFGSQKGTEKFYYAHRVESKPVFLVPDTVYTNLNVTLTDLRDKSITSVKKEDVRSFQLEHEGVTLVLAKGEKKNLGEDGEQESWTITQPRPLEGDSPNVSNFLYACQNLKTTRFFDSDREDNPEFGLVPPQVKITLHTADTNHTISVGSKVADKEDEFYISTSVFPGKVFAITKRDQESLVKDEFGFRDKTIQLIERDDMAKFTCQNRNGTTFVVERDGKKWKLMEPEQQDIPERQGNHMMTSMHNVRMQKLVAESATDLKPYGLDNPLMTITSELSDGTTKTLIVGDEDAATHSHYAKLPGSPMIFEIEAWVYGNMPDTLDEVKKWQQEGQAPEHPQFGGF